MRRKYSAQARRRGPAYVERAITGLARVVLHEIDALGGHVAEVRERLAVARYSRGVGDLLRVQLDLLPETRARLSLDHRERQALLHSWLKDLRAA